MIIDSWFVSKILNSTKTNQYSTTIYPEFIPEGKVPPCFIYTSIGSGKNGLERNKVFSLTCLHNTKSNVEAMNEDAYKLFDTSTAYIRESSSNLFIDSVQISENSVGGYDEINQYWFKVLDLSIWYHN